MLYKVSLANKCGFAAMFPGQGSQYIGMGKFLYEKYQTARDIFNLANDTLNFSLSDLCFSGDIKELTKTCNAQPALLTVSYAMYQVYIKEKNLKPSILLGHSLGEITALGCAGAISFPDGLMIARSRGTYMQQCGDKNKGSMLAILSDNFELIKKFCDEISNEKLILEVANYNSDRQVVMSGNNEALDILKEKLKKKDIKSIMLNVSAPFHSSVMKPASDNLYKKLIQYNYSAPSVPVISTVSGEPYSDQDDIAKNLSLQVIKPVQWVQSIKNARELGIKLFIEVGPKNVLKNLNKDICKDIKALSLDVSEDLAEFNRIQGVNNE